VRNRVDANCAQGLQSRAISLGPISNTGGVVTATATVEMVEFATQGVAFSIDGRYVSAVMAPGSYTLEYRTARLMSGSHTVTGTVVDAVGLLAESGKQKVSTSSGGWSWRPSQSKR
jgi:hypothetical protein